VLILAEFVDHAEAFLEALREVVVGHEKAKIRIAQLESELRQARAEVERLRTETQSQGV
jgi:TolA-binding protein